MIHTEMYKGYKIEIDYDQYPENPRTAWDNLGKMICFHGRYNLGDKHDYRAADCHNWDEMSDHIRKNERPVVWYSLYLYDHSGLTISNRPFSCPWDSGQVGFIIATEKAIRECFNIKRITKQYREKALSILSSEIETYDAYLGGRVYEYQISDEKDDVVSSLCGMYEDWEDKQYGALAEAKRVVDHMQENRHAS